MEIFYIILVLLFITRAFGEVAVRLGQPALWGNCFRASPWVC